MNKCVTILWLGLLSASLACGGGGNGGGGGDAASEVDANQPDAGPEADANQPDAAPLGAIAGTSIRRFVTEAGVETVPRDRTGDTLEALIPQVDGSYAVRPAEITGADTFVIPDVPEGEYLLNVNGTFVLTDARTLDLVETLVGRTDQTPITTSPTNLTFDVTNMQAFQGGDTLELYAPNAGAAFSAIEASTPVTDGATTLDITADVTAGERPFEIDDSVGDTAFLLHVAADVTPEGHGFIGLRAIADAQPFTLLDGQTATFQGAFTPVPQTSSRQLDWDAVALATAAAESVPGDPDSLQSRILGFVNVHDSRVARYSIPLLYETQADLTADLGPATVSYGNPFPAELTEFVTWAVFGLRFVNIEGSLTFTFGRAFATGPADQLLAGPIAPIVGAPRNVRIDGVDADLDNAPGISTTPRIEWSAPAFGQPSSYLVTLVQLRNTGNGFARVTVANFIVPATTTAVTLPPGLMVAGDHYFIRVRSEVHDAPDLVTRAFEGSDTLHVTEATSGVLSP